MAGKPHTKPIYISMARTMAKLCKSSLWCEFCYIRQEVRESKDRPLMRFNRKMSGEKFTRTIRVYLNSHHHESHCVRKKKTIEKSVVYWWVMSGCGHFSCSTRRAWRLHWVIIWYHAVTWLLQRMCSICKSCK